MDLEQEALKREEAVKTLIATGVSPDASLAELKGKNAELVKLYREVGSKLLRYQKLLSDKQRRLMAEEVVQRDKVVAWNMQKPAEERLRNKEAIDNRVRTLITACEETKTIYDEIADLEERVAAYKMINDLNTKIADRINDMLIIESVQRKMLDKHMGGIDAANHARE